jgi:N-glycosylase/DNA lyase
LRCSTFYEDFIKTLLTVNTSWSGTCRMVSKVVAEPGGGAFPMPEMLIEYGEERLRGIAKLGFRAPTAVAATRRMLDDGIIDTAGHGDPARLDHDYLVGLKGIGPYAAAHCRMLLHDFCRIPVDWSSSRICVSGTRHPGGIHRRARRMRPLSGLGYH